MPENNGKMEFEWGKSIFPIISCEFDREGVPHNPEFRGTGFFTVIEGYPLIISAKHVLGGFEGKTAEPCITTRFGAKPTLQLRGIVTEHQRIDIAFMILEPNYFKEHQSEFHPIPVVFETLSIGMDVFTLGYPNSRVMLDDFSGDKVVEIDQFFFKGYISNILDTTAIEGTKKSYLVNFPAMKGASGSPLLLAHEKKIVCVGFMFSGRSIHEKVDEKEIELCGEKVTIPLFQTYNFGVACDAMPLLEIRNLLSDIAKKFKK